MLWDAYVLVGNRFRPSSCDLFNIFQKVLNIRLTLICWSITGEVGGVGLEFPCKFRRSKSLVKFFTCVLTRSLLVPSAEMVLLLEFSLALISRICYTIALTISSIPADDL